MNEMPSSLSVRRFTDSLASMALTVKCLPTSRMNSIAPSFVSQSALLTGAPDWSAARSRGTARAAPECRRRSPRRVRVVSSARSVCLAARIANQPGPASDERDRRMSAALQVRERR